MAIVNPTHRLQAGSYTASNDRLHEVSAKYMPSLSDTFSFRARGGLLSYMPDKAAAYVVNSSPAWSVTVGPFAYLVENDFTTNGGDYLVMKTGNDVVKFTASSPTASRIDTVAVQVVDAFYSGAFSEGRLVVIQGTATTGTPSPPALPVSCEAIVDVSIPAGSTAPILSTDRRIRSGLLGTIVPIGGLQFPNVGTFSGETHYYEPLGTFRHWRGGSINEWRAFGGMLARAGAQLATSLSIPDGQEANSSQIVLNDPGGIWIALGTMQAEYSWSPNTARVDITASRNGVNNGTLFATTLAVVSGPAFPVSFAQMAGAQSSVLTGTQTIYFNYIRTFGGPATVTATPFNYRTAAIQLLVRAP
jgi:hypothetical protein